VVRQLVGHVPVDHGGVTILDPLYAEIDEDDNERICSSGHQGARLECAEGQDVGVYVATGLGDGRYPVFADIIEVPGAGKRVARIVVDCLGVEDEPASADLRGWLTASLDQLNAQTGWSVHLPGGRGGVEDDVRARALGEG
jgi:hypothetical protein